MKKILMLTLLSSCNFFTWASSDNITNCQNLLGTWINKTGSKLFISSIVSGEINGTYNLPPKIDSTSYSVHGVTNSKKAKVDNDNVVVISFAVQWKSLGSLTSWAGVCRSTNEQAKLEVLVHDIRPNAKNANEHMHTHYEEFTPIN